MKATEEMVSPILDRNKVEIANMVAFHLNLNTDAVNKLYNKLNNITPKVIIGWQCRKESWPDHYWSSVMLFPDDNVAFPAFSGEGWQFRHVYADA